MPARKPRSEEKPQFERFLETARRIGASETDEILEQVLPKLAKANPTKETKSAKQKKSST